MLVVQRMLRLVHPARDAGTNAGWLSCATVWRGPGPGPGEAGAVRRHAIESADVWWVHCLNRGVLARHGGPELSVAQVVDGARTVAVLEGVNDHENLGSIFRNAAGLGVDAVVFGSGCADPLYRRAVRVSMGHALLVPYARATDWPADLVTLKERGFRLLAMTPHREARELPEAMTAVRDERIAVLVGAEGPGLTAAAQRLSDMRVRIPMSRGTDSLNVATAAALAFHERARVGS